VVVLLASRAWHIASPHHRYEVVTAEPPPAGVLAMATRRPRPS
jgi:hypothetical protein